MRPDLLRGAPLAVCIAGASVPASAADAVSYALNPDDSALYVIVRSDDDAVLSALGRDHVVVATDFTGTVEWPATGDGCAVAIDVPVKELVVDPPAIRARAGLPGQTSDKDRAAITDVVMGDRVLDAARFHTIAFRAERCERDGDAIDVIGQLSLHGRSRPITAKMHVVADEGGIAATGRFRFAGTEFGMAPYRAAGGAIRHSDTLELVIDLKGSPK